MYGPFYRIETLNPSQPLTQLENIIAETTLVAMIRQEPAEISKVKNLEFKESYDNLDYLVYSILPLTGGEQVSLIRHKYSPDPGTEICVRYDQPDIARIVRDTLEELELIGNDLTWIEPKYEQEFLDLTQRRSFKSSSVN
jgi:hypothetical protein